MRQSVLAFLLLATSTLAMQSSSCYTITCSDTTAAAGGNCVTVSGSTVTLNACPSGSYCTGLDQFQSDDDHYTAQCHTDSSSGSSQTCPTYHENQLATYQYCCQNSDCASNNCDTSNHECIGIAEDGACTSSEACESGLYCSNGSSGTCVSTKSDGKECDYDYECDAGSGCFGTAYCFPYFSLDDGDTTVGNEYCKSGKMKNYKCDSLKILIGGSQVDEPWKCTIGQTCTYQWNIAGSTEDTALCECDGKGSTTGYCPIRGLSAIADFTDDFYEKFQYDSSDCSGDPAHITSLGSLSYLVYCNSIDQDGLDYYGEMVHIVNSWSLYSSGQVDDCADDLGLFDPSEDVDSWDSAEILALSALLILFN